MLKSINTLQIERTMIRMEMKTEMLPASDEKLFSFVAVLEGDEIGKGVGKSKKEAQQKAARAALENLDK